RNCPAFRLSRIPPFKSASAACRRSGKGLSVIATALPKAEPRHIPRYPRRETEAAGKRLRLPLRCGKGELQPAAKLIARSPGCPPRVFHFGGHGSCSRLIGGEARQIGVQIGDRDQRALARLASGALAALEGFVQTSA